MTTVRPGVNERALLAALPSIFTSSLTWVSELAQNARRAGATTVCFEITESKEPDYANEDVVTVTVTDDGCGIDDPSVLLNLGTSGWDEAIRLTETPFGMGFAAAIMSASEVHVRSNFGEITITQRDLLLQRPVEVRPSGLPNSSGTAVVLKFYGDKLKRRLARDIFEEIGTRLRRFPIPVTVHDVGLVNIVPDDNEFAFHCNDMRLISEHRGRDAFTYLPYPHHNLPYPRHSNAAVYVQGIRSNMSLYSNLRLLCIELGDSYIAQFPDRMRVVDFETTVVPKFEEAVAQLLELNMREAIPVVLASPVSEQAQFLSILYRSLLKPPPQLESLGVPGSMLQKQLPLTSNDSDEARVHARDWRTPLSGLVDPTRFWLIPEGIDEYASSFGFLRDVVAALLTENEIYHVDARGVAEDTQFAKCISEGKDRLLGMLGITESASEEWDEEAEKARASHDVDLLTLCNDKVTVRVNNPRTSRLQLTLGDTLLVPSQGRYRLPNLVFTTKVAGVISRDSKPGFKFSLGNVHVMQICPCYCCDSSESHDVLILLPTSGDIRSVVADRYTDNSLYRIIECAIAHANDYRDENDRVDSDEMANDVAITYMSVLKAAGLDQTSAVKDGLAEGLPLGVLLSDREAAHELVVHKGKHTSIHDIRVTYRRS